MDRLPPYPTCLFDPLLPPTNLLSKEQYTGSRELAYLWVDLGNFDLCSLKGTAVPFDWAHVTSMSPLTDSQPCLIWPKIL